MVKHLPEENYYTKGRSKLGKDVTKADQCPGIPGADGVQGQHLWSGY